MPLHMRKDVECDTIEQIGERKDFNEKRGKNLCGRT